jgi:hypothetical protein
MAAARSGWGSTMVSRRHLVAAVSAGLVLGALSACNIVTIDQHPCPPGGTTLTYENFGQAFFSANCNRCHSAAIGDRYGAPDTFAFDTIEEIRGHKDRIFIRSADTNDSMPPGPDDPPLAERQKLGDWLACGAP